MENKEVIQNLLEKSIKELGISQSKIIVVTANDLMNGDYSCNIAMTAAKDLGVSPLELAENIVQKINEQGLPDMLSSISVAAPGFINFRLSSTCVDAEINRILLAPEQYGKSRLNNGKRIVIEHSSPNLFKPFHIGHLMNNTIGESISRLAEFSSQDTINLSYPSDISLGIGKAIWVLMRKNSDVIFSNSLSIEEKIGLLGECYVEGTAQFEKDEEVQRQVRSVTQKLFDKIPGLELDLYTECRNINLNYFKDVTTRLGSSFDSFIFESEAGKEGEAIILKHIGDIFQQSEGAVIYRGEDFGLHTRVFINKEGYPTYECKDIGLLSLKFKRYNPDISIFITDHEQKNYFEVVSSAAGKINPVWSNRTVHKTHGRMSFKGQKMSSRLGGVPLAESIINTVCEDVSLREPSLNKDDIDIISIGAIKFSILRVMAGKNMNFDPDKSLSFEGDSGPYLQYTATRAQSVLKKAEKAGFKIDKFDQITSSRYVSELERIIIKFPEVVNSAIKEWAPHHIAIYLLELAQSFNSWYAGTKIIDAANPDMQRNIKTVFATRAVLENGLYILGIKIPKSM